MNVGRDRAADATARTTSDPTRWRRPRPPPSRASGSTPSASAAPPARSSTSRASGSTRQLDEPMLLADRERDRWHLSPRREHRGSSMRSTTRSRPALVVERRDDRGDLAGGGAGLVLLTLGAVAALTLVGAAAMTVLLGTACSVLLVLVLCRTGRAVHRGPASPRATAVRYSSLSLVAAARRARRACGAICRSRCSRLAAASWSAIGPAGRGGQRAHQPDDHHPGHGRVPQHVLHGYPAQPAGGGRGGGRGVHRAAGSRHPDRARRVRGVRRASSSRRPPTGRSCSTPSGA